MEKKICIEQYSFYVVFVEHNTSPIIWWRALLNIEYYNSICCIKAIMSMSSTSKDQSDALQQST